MKITATVRPDGTVALSADDLVGHESPLDVIATALAMIEAATTALRPTAETPARRRPSRTPIDPPRPTGGYRRPDPLPDDPHPGQRRTSLVMDE